MLFLFQVSIKEILWGPEICPGKKMEKKSQLHVLEQKVSTEIWLSTWPKILCNIIQHLVSIYRIFTLCVQLHISQILDHIEFKCQVTQRQIILVLKEGKWQLSQTTKDQQNLSLSAIKIRTLKNRFQTFLRQPLPQVKF